MRLDFRFAILMIVFFVSGLSGLVYEVVWTRRFTLLFGTSELATAAVLAAYLGGLGAGAAFAGRLMPRISRPLRAYALVELGVAMWALSVPFWVDFCRRLVAVILGVGDLPAQAGGLATALLYLLCCFATLLVPTGLMGAALPLLVRHTVVHDAQIGARVGALYAVNTAGAVAGALATGFLLVPALGLWRTTLVAVVLNLIAFAVALVLARREPSRFPAFGPDVVRGDPPAMSPIVVMVLLSSAVSFTYEVLWTRLLCHLLGSSVYAFSTMLASFLAGIAFGSGMASRLAGTRSSSRAGFAAAQVGAGLCSIVGFVFLDRLADLAAATGTGGDVLLVAATLFPGACCIGATFPFAVRFLARNEADAGQATARVYAWGTVGAIVGAVGAAFILLPGLGFSGTLTVAAAVNLVIAIGAGLFERARMWRLSAAAAAALAVLVVWSPSNPWKILDTAPLTPDAESGRRVFYSVGRSATVLLTDVGGEWMMRTNGLPEGSIQPAGVAPARYLVTRWLAVVPVLANPAARSMMVVGLGAGTVLESVPASVEMIDVVEIEPEVVAANRLVAAGRRRDPLADPRIRIVVNDVRSSLMLTHRRYDAVVSQPSHPWTASAAHLYTSEFFRLVRDHLTPGGVFVQWIGLNYVDQDLLAILAATVGDVFEHVQVVRPPTGAALFFVASDRPFDAIAGYGRLDLETRRQMVSLGVAGVEDVAVALVLDDAGVRRLGKGAPLNLDDRNLLQAQSPKVFGRALGRASAQSLLAAFDPLPEPLPPTVDRCRLVRRLAAAGQVGRARRVAGMANDPVQHRLCAALIASATGRDELAAQLAADIVGSDPSLTEARAMRLLGHRGALSRGREPDPRLLPLESGERALVDGWRLAATNRWAPLELLDHDLAALPPSHPLFAAACRLRAGWRVVAGGSRRAREAVVLMDEVLALDPRPNDLLLHAEASMSSGRHRGALVTLSGLARGLPRTERFRLLVERALRLVQEIPDEPDLVAVRADIVERLRASVGTEPETVSAGR